MSRPETPEAQMTDITKLSAVPSHMGRPTPGQAPERDRQPEAPSRSLVPLPGSTRRGNDRGPRPSPAFLAHLIATALKAPQTRARARIAPADASARYASTIQATRSSSTTEWSA